ncbi:hypothetical protein BDZ91DRAFT_768730 [Kalaharituber pfeilii]|nr:hypothetical protein BDZ91DRAFT_768730 [Kalaharituber pfeilii]
MADSISIGAPAAVEEGHELRSLLGEQNSTDTVMREATSTDSTQIDIPTTAAAFATAQQAQIQNAMGQEEENEQQQQQQQQHTASDPAGLTMSVVSVIQRDSPPVARTQDSQHQSSPVPVGSPQDVSDHDMRLSPMPGDMVPPTQICLCQQPARIPRPRNAFILFRQHNHASVVQANPGKPNPEISKIIGEMWRESSKETKIIWQKHAEEEKRKHLVRYPEYKYQPRRSGKKGNQALGSAGIPGMMESAICSACGGHTGALNTPDTPSTPMTATPLSAPPMSAAAKTFRNTYMPTPRTPSASFTPILPIPKSARRRRNEGDPKAGVEALLQLGLPEQDDGELSPTGDGSQSSQASKKRRLDITSPTTSGDLTMDSLRTPRSSGPLLYGQDPNIDPFLKHPNLPEGSESLVGNTSELENGSPFSTTAVAEDILKNIPVLSKLQAIAKICKPLPAPDVVPGASPRGAIIAIEGEDAAAVTALCDSLADTLKGELVEVIDLDDAFEGSLPLGERNTQFGDNQSRPDNMHDSLDGEAPSDHDYLDEDGVKTAKYLRSVADWRLQSNKMRRKVMPMQGTGCQSSNLESQSDNKNPTSSNIQQNSSNSSHPTSKLPILLLNRYILSRTDSAIATLSPDGLTCLQHWQWAASIWKGCVGADMTILVKTDEPAGADPVEVKDPGKVLVARKDIGKEWDGGRVRRLGFEVNECVRTLMGANS